MNIQAVIWLGLAVALAALEAGTTQFVSIWFSLAAVAATVLALIGVPIGLQILVFIVASAVLVATLRPLSRRLARPGKIRLPQTPTNADRAIGETAVVVRDIAGGDVGQVKVNGLVWSAVARGSAEGAVIPAGERVRVLAIEGAKLIVLQEAKDEKAETIKVQ
ncbi:MAG: NfeD family protein [Oscillospiraceae bacterium]|jgi:membrane protein implicated in regulation of membrane protease activity|nr:NfeD family protein [Oscillospiraceae bacterium]